MKTILVIGGTGRLAQPVVKALVSSGYHVRILTRSPMPDTNGITWHVGSLQDRNSLMLASEGVAAVYLNLPATLHPSADFIPELHGMQNLLDVMSPQVLLLKLSEIGASDDQHFTDLRYKHLAEQMIINSGFPYIIFRPTWFMESLPLLLTRGRLIIYAGKQSSPIYWIAGQDYAMQVIAALRQASTVGNHVFTVQGPEALTFREAIRRYIHGTKDGLLSLSLPLWVLRIGGLFDIHTRFNYEVMRYYNYRQEVFEATETWALLGKPETTMDQFARMVASNLK